jgi:lysophospholipase L1-like esterase
VGDDLDAAVLLAGANDVMGRRSPGEWRDDLTAIVDNLMGRAGHVIVAGTPPFALFPAMPATLGRYLSERAALLDEVARQVCLSRPCTTWVTMPGVTDPEFFSGDRFHPSAAGYRTWAQVIAGRLPL